ncbi:MAG: DoxX family protein [Pseudomonadota bacterium]
MKAIHRPSSSTMRERRGGWVGAAVVALDRLPLLPAEVLFRLAMAILFWRSGQAKLASWDTTVLLFQEEYRVPLLAPELAAMLATAVELAAPVALLLGFGTRVAALATLGMTFVIQIFVYPESYPTHLLWAGPLLYLLLRGPGTLSLDHAIRRQFMA